MGTGASRRCRQIREQLCVGITSLTLTPRRCVIVVSIVSGGGEVCIAYTSVLVNLLDPKHVFGYLYQEGSVD